MFLYFSDHGAPGHLIMPNGAIFADELHTMITDMHEASLYRELALFIEACESGSMFKGFDLKPYNAWAMTATDEVNPSYGTYCHPHDIVEGKHMYTCLGDLFSVSWMEFVEENMSSLSSLSL